MNLLESFDSRLFAAYGFIGFIAIIVGIVLFLLIRGIIRGRRYESESLPSLADLGLGFDDDDEDDNQALVIDNDDYAFSISDDDGLSSGDAEADTLLREVNQATLSNGTGKRSKRKGLFSRK